MINESLYQSSNADKEKSSFFDEKTELDFCPFYADLFK